MGRRAMPEAERFMSHVAKDGSGCWLWSAFCMKSGYGNFRTPLRHELAHRAAYRLFKGELQSGLDVMADAKAKGRTARGTSHGMNKISQTDAIAIREARCPQAELAAQFGLSQTTISQIQTGKRWMHLEGIGG